MRKLVHIIFSALKIIKRANLIIIQLRLEAVDGI